jgi:hypothetical protein
LLRRHAANNLLLDIFKRSILYVSGVARSVGLNARADYICDSAKEASKIDLLILSF